MVWPDEESGVEARKCKLKECKLQDGLPVQSSVTYSRALDRKRSIKVHVGPYAICAKETSRIVNEKLLFARQREDDGRPGESEMSWMKRTTTVS